MKNGLDEAKTVLWAAICWPSSQARVTSVKSLSFLNSLKKEVVTQIKAIDGGQSFSEEPIPEVRFFCDTDT